MIAVACAIIEWQGKVLVTQRGLHKAEGGLWEFPGGKLEAGETPEACIVREIAEELEIVITPYQQLPPAEHHYANKSIRLMPLICRWTGGSLHLHEHNAFQWLRAQELQGLNWCPADIPVVKAYQAWLLGRSQA